MSAQHENPKMKKFSIAAFTFLILTVAFSTFAQNETRTAAAWLVKKYDITVTLPQNPNDRFLTARTVLQIQNVGNGNGTRITLRTSDKAEVTAARVNDAAATFTKGEEKLTASRNLQRTIVNLPSVAPNGTFNIAVEYRLKVDENSGVGALSPAGAQFLPLAFWYPTPASQLAARGADFAPFTLNIVSPFETVVSSGAQNATSFNQNLSGQPFFVAGQWDKIEANGVSVFMPKGADAEARKRAEELSALAGAAKSYTAGLLGSIDFPVRLVAVQRGGGFADGGTILIPDAVFRRQKLDSLTAMTIAEAVAKVWLGNAATVRGDGFGVVREGLARFIATQFLEKQFGKEAAELERYRQRTAYAAVAKRDAPLNLVTPLDDYYFAAVANKGAMVWRLLARTTGEAEFFAAVKSQLQSRSLSLSQMRAAFPAQKTFLDYQFDQPTEMNLLAGIPQPSGGQTKVALRNLGSIEATVNVSATTERGEKLSAQATVPARSFGEATFQTPNKIVRAEIDPEKFYPQNEYFDDVAPRESAENDAVLIIKRAFDKQEFVPAEKAARDALRSMPNFDDARVWLGRALFAQGKTPEAEKEFRAVLNEKLPTARSLAWANLGLGEISLKANQNAQAAAFFVETIKADAEYGATLAARAGRNKADQTAAGDSSVVQFFSQFDKAAVSSNKSALDALIMPGEIPRFSGGISGQAQQWQTTVLKIDRVDAANVLAEVSLNIRLLNKEPETGTAVYRLSKSGDGWKITGVEIFEVR